MYRIILFLILISCSSYDIIDEPLLPEVSSSKTKKLFDKINISFKPSKNDESCEFAIPFYNKEGIVSFCKIGEESLLAFLENRYSSIDKKNGLKLVISLDVNKHCPDPEDKPVSTSYASITCLGMNLSWKNKHNDITVSTHTTALIRDKFIVDDVKVATKKMFSQLISHLDRNHALVKKSLTKKLIEGEEIGKNEKMALEFALSTEPSSYSTMLDKLNRYSKMRHYQQQRIAAAIKSTTNQFSNSMKQMSQSNPNLYRSSGTNKQNSNSYAQPVSQSFAYSCGIKPIPNIGCRIGRCIDGDWEQICNNMTCGIKPIPNIGCRIGRCIDGSWEQVCNNMTCGIKPIPNIGCQIGRCVDGHWEQVCN